MLLNDKLKPYRLLLASQSPRRRELMTGCGLPYELAEKFDCEETYPDDLPLIGVSEYLSTLKSEAYPVPLLENDILLTADTVVLAGGEFRMLKILSGAHHLVTTGVTLRSAARMTHFTSLTYVWFRTLTDEEIAYYVDTFQPFDKAGAYGIQEWIGYAAIECIEGSFYNVMGLPVEQLGLVLARFGVKLL